MAVMVRVVFMCGPAGSGKSTIARDLEAAGMERLSFDRIAWDRGHRAMPVPASEQEAISHQLRARLLELVDAGDDVVLDFSFWSRAMRDEWRQLLGSRGVVPELYYVATTRETVLKRIRERVAADGDGFPLDEATAREYFERFEAPTDEEGPFTVFGS